MSAMLEKAINMIRVIPEDKLYYVVQLLEGVEGLSAEAAKGTENMTPEMKALEDLQRFRRKGKADIDYKAELAKAREEKYAGVN